MASGPLTWWETYSFPDLSMSLSFAVAFLQLDVLGVSDRLFDDSLILILPSGTFTTFPAIAIIV